MSVPRDEHERILAFAEIALGQTRALGQPATPRNFEIWYHYATGYKPALKQSINEALAKKGALSEADLEQTYDTYIATGQIGESIDSLGSRVLEEVKQVLDMIDAAAGSATSYSESLADASKKLEHAKDGDALRAVIEYLVQGAKEMEQNNKKLETRLAASKQEIEQLQQNLETVRTESLTDPLTTLSNRKFFDSALAKNIAEAKQKNQPLSLLMADIVKQNVKGQAVAARYGGEEFVIALPNTALKSAITVADHIRRAVMTKELMKRSSGERLGRVSISIGARCCGRRIRRNCLSSAPTNASTPPNAMAAIA